MPSTVNPSTAFAATLVDELVRCGLREAVLAPGSRSAPLAIALWDRAARDGELRLHVRIDERSAAFLALGLAKASGRPVAVVCTSGTAAANFHPAVIEADESGVPLLVLTADRPPELRGTGANQAIDQLKLYGGAVRWFAEAGVPEARPGMNAYWRSLACRAWAAAAGADGGFPGPVHLNLPLRDPLVPGLPDRRPGPAAGPSRWTAGRAGPRGPGGPPPGRHQAAPARGPSGQDGRGRWTCRGPSGGSSWRGTAPPTRPGCSGWRPRRAGRCWPSRRPGRGRAATRSAPTSTCSSTRLSSPRTVLTWSSARAGRGCPAARRRSCARPRPDGARQVVLAQGPGRWADPARTATDVAAAVRLTGPGPPAAAPGAGRRGWLGGWQEADAAARSAVDAVLDAGGELTEPRLARDLAAALPDGALLWAASSLPIRDLDRHLAPRDGLRVLASRGASGIDGLVSSATGAALAHQAAGGGPAAALLGDLAFLHDAPGLFAGPEEARPDLVLVVANNDGGGIFSTLEQAAVPAPFERVFGTPHGARPGRPGRGGRDRALGGHPGGGPARRAEGRRDPHRRGARGPGRRDGAAAAAGGGRGCGGRSTRAAV